MGRWLLSSRGGHRIGRETWCAVRRRFHGSANENPCLAHGFIIYAAALIRNESVTLAEGDCEKRRAEQLIAKLLERVRARFRAPRRTLAVLLSMEVLGLRGSAISVVDQVSGTVWSGTGRNCSSCGRESLRQRPSR